MTNTKLLRSGVNRKVHAPFWSRVRRGDLPGLGNTKEEMISFARANGFNPANDDEADALAILYVGLNLPNKNNDFISKQDSFWELSDRAQRVFQ